MPFIKAVSYTHLDVYKRQVEEGEAEGEKRAKQPLKKAKCKEAKEKGYGRQERKS